MLKKIINKFFLKNLKSIDDFKLVLKKANKNNIINSNLYQIIYGALQIANLVARDAMVPKTKMVVIKEDATIDEYLEIITTSAHSRFPIVDQDNKVKGILLAKDLLNFLAKKDNNNKFDYKDYLREALVVPEEKSLESLLSFFQQNRTHMVIVLDEYSEISGLITLEDVLEQIVGEIEDEHDFEEENIIDYGKGRFLVRGYTTIAKFNEFFTTNFSTESETIAGMVIKEFGYMPKQLESLSIDNLDFKVLKSNDRRVVLLEVIKNNG